MKLLIIKGSYHKHGFIAYLVEEVVKGYKSINEDNEVEIIDLLDANVKFCKGCYACVRDDKNKSIGKCVTDDDMTVILEKMLEANRLVLASPVYYAGLTALMKSFVERTFPFCFMEKDSFIPKYRLKAKKDKKGYAMVSTDCPSPWNDLFLLTIYPKLLLKAVLKIAQCGKRSAVALSPYQKEKAFKKAYKIGQKLAR